MNDEDYYSLVAGRMILSGLKRSEVNGYVHYKWKNTFKDLESAFRRGLDGIEDKDFPPKVSSVAAEIRKVIEIDHAKFDEIYGGYP